MNLKEIVKLWKEYENHLEAKYKVKVEDYRKELERYNDYYEAKFNKCKKEIRQIDDQIDEIEKRRERAIFKSKFDHELKGLRLNRHFAFIRLPSYHSLIELMPTRKPPTVDGFLSYLANKEEDENQ